MKVRGRKDGGQEEREEGGRKEDPNCRGRKPSFSFSSCYPVTAEVGPMCINAFVKISPWKKIDQNPEIALRGSFWPY